VSLAEPSRQGGAAGDRSARQKDQIRSTETRLDGSRLVVRIAFAFSAAQADERLVALAGCELAPSSKPQPDRTLVKALARARRLQATALR